LAGGKGGKVAAARWQLTLYDPMWHVISRSGEVISTNCYTHLHSHTPIEIRYQGQVN